MKELLCRAALDRNLEWFRRSGIMKPADGSWGVAERIVLTRNNAAAEQITRSFPAWTPCCDHLVIEQRRSDCNFQTAWLMMLAADAGIDGAEPIAERILEFLYWRSGLLDRGKTAFPDGVWNWSHIRWAGIFWLDDNGWVALLQWWMALARPAWDRRFDMLEWAVRLTGELHRTMERGAEGESDYRASDPEKIFNGNFRQPHWGAPVVLALLAGARITGEAAWRNTAERYLKYLLGARENFNNSESAYAVLALATAVVLLPDEPCWRQGALDYGSQLEWRMAANNGIPAAEHGETPQGRFLFDTIYTANWLLLGFQALSRLPEGRMADRECYEKLLGRFLEIQDVAPDPFLHGCWRGMYDCRRHCWGGGDQYEGGANSIYSGWTNAPISAALAMELRQTSIAHSLETLCQSRENVV